LLYESVTILSVLCLFEIDRTRSGFFHGRGARVDAGPPKTRVRARTGAPSSSRGTDNIVREEGFGRRIVKNIGRTPTANQRPRGIVRRCGRMGQVKGKGEPTHDEVKDVWNVR
jgi:hypothetical protein